MLNPIAPKTTRFAVTSSSLLRWRGLKDEQEAAQKAMCACLWAIFVLFFVYILHVYIYMYKYIYIYTY